MHDLETIDAELRLLAAIRRACREESGTVPSVDVANALWDERNSATRCSADC